MAEGRTVMSVSLEGLMLADALALMGSLDLVISDIGR